MRIFQVHNSFLFRHRFCSISDCLHGYHEILIYLNFHNYHQLNIFRILLLKIRVMTSLLVINLQFMMINHYYLIIILRFFLIDSLLSGMWFG